MLQLELPGSSIKYTSVWLNVTGLLSEDAILLHFREQPARSHSESPCKADLGEWLLFGK